MEKPFGIERLFPDARIFVRVKFEGTTLCVVHPRALFDAFTAFTEPDKPISVSRLPMRLGTGGDNNFYLFAQDGDTVYWKPAGYATMRAKAALIAGASVTEAKTAGFDRSHIPVIDGNLALSRKLYAEALLYLIRLNLTERGHSTDFPMADAEEIMRRVCSLNDGSGDADNSGEQYAYGADGVTDEELIERGWTPEALAEVRSGPNASS